MSETTAKTNTASAYLRPCGHLGFSLGGPCPVCADVKAARVAGMEAAYERGRQDVLKYQDGVLQTLKRLLGRAFPEEGQAWGILLSESEYDAFKDLCKTTDKLIEAPR